MEIPAGLVGGNNPLAGGVQIEVARGPSPCFLNFDQAQFPTAPMNVETGDAVMAAVGGVEELATRMHEDFRC